MCYLVSFLLLAMTPADIEEFFVPVFKQAQVFREVYNTTNKENRRKIKMPFVTVSVYSPYSRRNVMDCLYLGGDNWIILAWSAQEAHKSSQCP